MDWTSGIIALSAMLAVALPGIFVALGQAKVAQTTMENMAKQPELAGQLRSTMILAMGLMEALAIYGLLVAFILMGKF